MPTIKNVTCPVCGTFCDDIELTIKNNKITDVKNACAMGEAKFLGYADTHHRNTKPQIRKNGELVETTWNEAIKKAAQILAEAKYPLLYGWSSTSCEAIRFGVELAEETGGVIDNTSSVCHGPSILSIQDQGISTCTLGQIRHRADLIVYWGSDPYSAHPRHLERYTAFTDGRFEPSEWRRYVSRLRGVISEKKLARASKLVLMEEASIPPITGHQIPPMLEMEEERKLIVIDVRRTRSAEFADYFIQVEPNKDYELLQAMRMLVKNEELEVDQVAGVPVDVLEKVVDVMINCKFGIFFFGVGLTMSVGKHRNIDAALALTIDLNFRTKFVIMPMRGHFNVTGANTVFLWQTGYPFAIDFSQGYPKYNPGETSTVDILARDESDAALVIASDPVANFPKNAAQNLVKNPLIVIDPEKSATALMADVVLPSAFVGIEAEGTAYRMDSVPLPLKKVVKPSRNCLSDEKILQRILKEVRRLKKAAKET
ncbi:MAG TPA: formylmethanofuran dehydrogenase subunit B [Candidatus Krumholzibacteriaceae bacterium]|jgi:formylmethanofuran dehydrogenase subunit B|nr:formylmethanofuran dehydrogenase subunit B [Candidatus Krumholzibacteriaceae bacterium]